MLTAVAVPDCKFAFAACCQPSLEESVLQRNNTANMTKETDSGMEKKGKIERRSSAMIPGSWSAKKKYEVGDVCYVTAPKPLSSGLLGLASR